MQVPITIRIFNIPFTYGQIQCLVLINCLELDKTLSQPIRSLRDQLRNQWLVFRTVMPSVLDDQDNK